MGFFGTYRYHEPWEPVDVEVAAKCGLPRYSLYWKKCETRDGKRRVLYHEKLKFLSLRHKTDIYDATDRLVAHYERELLSLHYRYYIRMDDGSALETYNRDDKIEISPLG